MFYEGVTPLDEVIEAGKMTEWETFPNPMKSGNGVVRIVFQEFTCVCPKTGYPDFGSIELYYLPNDKCVELKSWKLWLNSFRMIGTFHETVTDYIFGEVVRQLDPKWAMVVGDFFPRGNVDTTVVLETETPRPASADIVMMKKAPHGRSF